jgi:hypothetical protein
MGGEGLVLLSLSLLTQLLSLAQQVLPALREAAAAGEAAAAELPSVLPASLPALLPDPSTSCSPC